MQQLRYATTKSARSPGAARRAEVKPAELDLALKLIDQIATDKFKPEQYKDEVREGPRLIGSQDRRPGDHRRAAGSAQGADHRPHGSAQGELSARARASARTEALERSEQAAEENSRRRKSPPRLELASSAPDATAARRERRPLASPSRIAHCPWPPAATPASISSCWASHAPAPPVRRRGFVTPRSGPRGTQRFSFQDLSGAAPRSLLAGKLPARRVHEALRRPARATAERPNAGADAHHRRQRPRGGARRRRDLGARFRSTGLRFRRRRAGAEGRSDRAPRRRRGAPPRARARRRRLVRARADLEATAPVDAEDALPPRLALECAHDARRISAPAPRGGRPACRRGALSLSAAALHPSDPTPNFTRRGPRRSQTLRRSHIVAYQSAITADPSFADAYQPVQVYEKLGRGTSAFRASPRRMRQLVRGPR